MSVVPGSRATRVMDGETAKRVLRRLAHEIRERHANEDRLVIAGIREGGVAVAQSLGNALDAIGHPVRRVSLDVTGHRDDLPRSAPRMVGGIEVEIDECVVILVDDVVQTGRTMRAALDALSASGRPAAVEALVLIDRGHRELPIRPSYVGKNIPAAADDWVDVVLDSEKPDENGVFLVKRA